MSIKLYIFLTKITKNSPRNFGVINNLKNIKNISVWKIILEMINESLNFQSEAFHIFQFAPVIGLILVHTLLPSFQSDSRHKLTNWLVLHAVYDRSATMPVENKPNPAAATHRKINSYGYMSSYVHSSSYLYPIHSRPRGENKNTWNMYT